MEGTLLALMHAERERKAQELGRAMSAAFFRIQQEGRCHRPRALVTLRVWWKEMATRGSDVTWGAFEAVGQALGVSKAELEGEEGEGMQGGISV